MRVFLYGALQPSLDEQRAGVGGEIVRRDSAAREASQFGMCTHIATFAGVASDEALGR